MSATRFVVAHFCDVAAPLINGIVRAVGDLIYGQAIGGTTGFTIAPGAIDEKPGLRADGRHVALPSFTLPTSSGYRGAMRPPGPGVLQTFFNAAPGIAHAHSFFRAAAFARRCAREYKIPFVLTYHTRLSFYAHYAGPFAGLFRALMPRYLAFIANRAHAIFAPSLCAVAELRAAGVTKPVHCIPHGIATDAFRFDRPGAETARLQLRKHYGITASQRLVICVARLAREKNCAMVLRAAAHFPSDVAVLFCGTGPECRRLQNLAAKLVPGQILFAGAVPPHRMPDLYAAADACIFPSISESQGLVLWEAYCAGLPIVAADCEVAREMLTGVGIRFTAADGTDCAEHVQAACSDGSRAAIFAQRRAHIPALDRITSARRTLEIYAGLYAASPTEFA